MGKLCKTGKSRQILYDAIKQVEKTQQNQWINFYNKRLELAPIDHTIEWTGINALVKFKGKIHLSYLIEKDGLRASSLMGKYISRKIQPQEVLVFVKQIHKR